MGRASGSTPRLEEAWLSSGRRLEVLGHSVFVRDTGGSAFPVVLLHGYPTSSFDYVRALPYLSAGHRVVVHDHVGFGFSAKPTNYRYSLVEQADVALALWRKLGITSAHVLAHDYGTSVATELLAREARGGLDFEITRLTLCNGSMHIELAKLRPIQRMLRTPLLGSVVARLSTERVFIRNMRKLFADPSTVGADELAAMWRMLVGDGGRRVLPKITRYLDERREKWDRWIGALRTTKVPIHIVWAVEDPVAVVNMAHVLHEEIKHSRLTLLEQLGHFPMLEGPERWATAVLS